jgi:hypothetical protein
MVRQQLDEARSRPAVDNLLSKILIVPQFLSAERCDNLLKQLAGQPERRAVLPSGALPLEAAFKLADLAEPARLLGSVQRSQIAAAVLMKYVDPAAIQQLRAARGMADVGKEMGSVAVQALDSASGDPRFFPGLAGLLAIPEGSASHAELAQLMTEGIIERDGSGYAVREGLDERQSFALRWFNIRLLEEIVFPEGLVKCNRLVSRDFATEVARGALATTPLAEFLSDAAPDLALLVATSKLGDALYALHQLFLRSELRAPFFERFSATTLGVAGESNDLPQEVRSARDAIDANDDVPWGMQLWVMEYILHRLCPDLFTDNLNRTVVSGIRRAQTLETGPTQAELVDVARCLQNDYLEPYFGIHVIADYSMLGVLKYTPGGFYVPHIDACERKDVAGQMTWMKSAKEDVSLLIYLSRASDYEGGALVFPELSVSVRPQQGMAIAFPSDYRFPHGVEPITSGVRYVIFGGLCCEEGVAVGEPFTIRW